MALANELSSEIAAAILSRKNSRAELEELKRVVEEVRATLEQLENRKLNARKSPQPLARTAAGDR